MSSTKQQSGKYVLITFHLSFFNVEQHLLGLLPNMDTAEIHVCHHAMKSDGKIG